MLADTLRELARIASHLGLEVTEERLRTAIEQSSADRMRALEKLDKTSGWRPKASQRHSLRAGGRGRRMAKQASTTMRDPD